MHESLAVDIESPRRAPARRRRSNRRVVVQRRPALVAVADGMGALGRGVWRVTKIVGKALLAIALVCAVAGGGTIAARHVLASPRFALREVIVSPTARITRDEIFAVTGLKEGDRLLAIDTDEVAARVAQHPWVAEARVRRHLPSGLHIDIVERRAAAVVALGGLYLIDENGRPFKRAVMAEAEGLPVFTGIDRARYVDHRPAAEGAFREALGVVAAWKAVSGRPALSEVNIDPRHGFTAFLLEGAAEIRLGRGHYDRKLARLDRILESVKASGDRLQAVHLDGKPDAQFVTARLAQATPSKTAP